MNSFTSCSGLECHNQESNLGRHGHNVKYCHYTIMAKKGGPLDLQSNALPLSYAPVDEAS